MPMHELFHDDRARVSVLFLIVLALPRVSFAATVPVNSVIDLSMPAPVEPQTDAEVFDESVIFAPNFAINQNDPSLSDLFDSQGKSELCFPTSIAEVLIDLFAYHAPKFDALKLSGLTGAIVDPDAVVRQMFTLCRTARENGTDSLDALGCTLSILAHSGYGAGDTRLISPFNQSASLPIVSRAVTIRDLRDALGAGHPVVLEVSWFSFDPAVRQWTRSGGHYVSAYGYDYDRSWGEDQIQLKVVNPETQFSQTREYALFDTITIERVSPQPGILYPPQRPFVLSGAGFGGTIKRGFLGMILVVAPSL